MSYGSPDERCPELRQARLSGQLEWWFEDGQHAETKPPRRRIALNVLGCSETRLGVEHRIPKEVTR